MLDAQGIEHIDTKHRAFLQKALMEKMLGKEPSPQQELDWANEYREVVAEIIDGHAHEDIRKLLEEEKYDEAAESVEELLLGSAV